MDGDSESKARRDAAMEAFLARQKAEDAARQAESAAATTAPAGWYPHPTMAGTQRYWDGQKWTDHIAPVGAPTAGSTAKANWKRPVAVLAGIAVFFGGVWFFFGYNSGENKAIRACHDYVELRLKAPATAEFSGEFAVDADDGQGWEVHGVVDSENGFGAKVRNVYTCQVNEDYTVTDSHFSEDDE
jgi:hypothetical protein